MRNSYMKGHELGTSDKRVSCLECIKQNCTFYGTTTGHFCSGEKQTGYTLKVRKAFRCPPALLQDEIRISRDVVPPITTKPSLSETLNDSFISLKESSTAIDSSSASFMENSTLESATMQPSALVATVAVDKSMPATNKDLPTTIVSVGHPDLNGSTNLSASAIASMSATT
ncbi:unnamed protein product, partial [Orchesella dallaii]